eukprot:gene339-351_t
MSRSLGAMRSIPRPLSSPKPRGFATKLARPQSSPQQRPVVREPLYRPRTAGRSTTPSEIGQEDPVAYFLSTQRDQFIPPAAAEDLASSDIRIRVLRGAFCSEPIAQWIAPSWKLHIFVSSTFTDTHEERNLLMDRIYPRLSLQGFRRGIDVSFSDMRWGIPSESEYLHLTWEDCRDELQRCIDQSSGLCFLSLQSDKQELEARKGLIDDPVKLSVIEYWYRLDKNADPPEYFLRDLESREEYSSFWSDDVQGTLKSLLRGVMVDDVVRVGRSVTEFETRYALSRLINENIIGEGAHRIYWISRHFEDMLDVTNTNYYDGLNKEDECKLTSSGDERLKRLLGIKGDSRNNLEELIEWMKNAVPTDRRKIYSRVRYSDLVRPQQLLSFTRHFNYIRDWEGEVSAVLDRSLESVAFRKLQWDNDGFGIRFDLLEKSTSSVALLLLGLPGTGKSSFIAELANRAYRDERRDGRPVIVRFCGTSCESSSIPALVVGLCHHIRCVTGMGYDADSVPSELHGGIAYLHKLLHENPVVLFLDSLDVICDAVDSIGNMGFLKGLVPHKQTKLIVSLTGSSEALDGSGMDRTMRGCEDLNENDLIYLISGSAASQIELHPKALLPFAETLIRKLLQLKSRTISSDQMLLVLCKCEKEPSVLYTVLSSIVVTYWRCYQNKAEARFGGRVKEVLENTTEGVAGQLLEIFEVRFGSALIKAIQGYLTFAVNGVSEVELLDLLSLKDDVMQELTKYNDTKTVPRHVWVRVRHALGDLLVERDEGCLCWHYDVFKRLVGRKFGNLETIALNEIMGKYFTDLYTVEELGDEKFSSIKHQHLIRNPEQTDDNVQYNRRRTVEATHHLIAAGMYREAKEELCSITTVVAFAKTNDSYSILTRMQALLRVEEVKDERLEQYSQWVLDRGVNLGVGCNDSKLMKLSESPTPHTIVENDLRVFLQKSSRSQVTVETTTTVIVTHTRESITRSSPTAAGMHALSECTLAQRLSLPALPVPEPLDMIIRVMHCSNCRDHNMSLRHNESKYLDCASDSLKWLALAGFMIAASSKPKELRSRKSGLDERYYRCHHSHPTQ